MDASGKNRYELLFMDDDVSDPLDNVVKKKVKQAAGAAAPVAAPAAPAKGAIADAKKKPVAASANAEKENKSGALNKNSERKAAAGAAAGAAPVPANKAKFAVKDSNSAFRGKDQDQRQPREGRVNYKQQNGETREQRNNRRNRDDRQNGTVAQGESFNTDQQRPQRTNRGPPRPRNFENRGKREFDRQSGSDKTGVKSVDKREGGGAHNWGNAKQDIEDLNKSIDESGLTDKEESANDQSATEQQAAIEEEAKELTLDEWKAQRQQRAKPQYNIRKAGEGEDQSQWKKMIALNNKKKASGGVDGVSSEDEFEYDPSMYPQRVGRLQRVLDIEFHFNDGRRSGGIGRGGRGGRPRGPPQEGGAPAPRRAPAPGGPEAGAPRGAGAGRPRNENQRPRGDGGDRLARGQRAPKVDDERQFPTLS